MVKVRTPTVYDGKEVWCGSFSLCDGVIEEVHTADEAECADYHHSLYFSAEQAKKIDEDENGFFWIDSDGTLMLWKTDSGVSFLRKIKEQLESHGG